ncbi:unnamed protein product [Psylliodes chrysocephalus]|uniref:Chitinase n=1 Tax=Psylliodes chrysocephalus TaxID=3402493 RepID=A0A9P0G9K2_9CUCU|nr:unnamed protein product [Psylliodes chrysocephala]
MSLTGMENRGFSVCVCILVIGFVNSHILENFNREDINTTARWKRQSQSYKCTLPKHPDNGRWLIINGDGKPGDQIDINTILKIECLDGYRLNPIIPFVACDVGFDPNKFPKCEKKCPSFYSTATTTLKCVDRDGNKIGCDQAIDGTYLTFDCIAYYEVPPGNKRSLFCRAGTWDFPKPVCQPVCGKKVNNETIALSYGGKEVKDLEYPWVIAIYRKQGGSYQNICGGTLVSRRIVLTAAHCVTNDYGVAQPKELFEVAAGKYYNAYGDPRDQWVQYRKISKLIVKDGYRGESQRYAADIAVIVLEKLFRLGPVVQPVCINNLQNIYLKNRQMGEVAGWGITEKNQVADRLRVIKIPYKEKSTCSQELPAEWEEKYNFLDKICAGYYKRNISVCKGDSGSGLVFVNSEDSRYYIHGIVSIAPNLFNLQCNYETNALYTSIAFYYSFIDVEIQKHYVEDCKLPAHPENGKWSLENDAEKYPGEIVPSTSILKFSCHRGYKLSSASQYYECENTYNAPTCKLLCPKLDFPKKTITSCKNSREQVIDCADASDGSSVTYVCPAGFETDRGTSTSTRYCINGSYGKPKPDCLITGSGGKNTTTETSPGSSVYALDGQKVICTYASWWAYEGILPEDLDPMLCTHVVYEFIGLWDKGDVRVQDDGLDLDQEQRGLYNRITDMKKKNKDLKVLLSVGGTLATNSTLFRRVAGHAAKTGAFLGSAGYFLKTYHFDGIDIDWQYPEESDMKTYIDFLKIVKDEFDRNGWLLSATVRPYLEGTGYNVTAMNRILDWVTIRSFDFFGGEWSNSTGIHNALYASSKDDFWQKRHSNMDSVAKTWIHAGLSKEKLVLSIAFYGRSFTLKDPKEHGLHAPITGPGPGVDGGFVRYYELCSTYKNNYTEEWDDETKAVYKYNDSFWIGFNTKDAVWTRGDYIKKNGYAGVNVFPWDGDDNKGICGMKHILLKHVHGGMGHPVDWDH